MEEPWGHLRCGILTNIQLCSQMQQKTSRNEMWLQRCFDNFTPLNITVNNLRNSTHNCTIDSTIIEGSMSYGKLTKEIKTK